MRLGRPVRWMAGLACVALAATACSNTGGTGSSSVSPAGEVASVPQLPGDPVVIGSMYPINATLATFPDLQYLAQIAVDVVNSNGGIKGHPLKWEHCDDKGDPNVAATCADQLINQDKVKALVESVGLEGNVAWPLIKKANIINWFDVPIWPEDGTNGLSYPAGLGVYAQHNVGLLVKQGEFKKVDCLTAAGAFASTLCDLAKSSLAAKGITDFKTVTWPPTTTAFQPYAAKVLSDNADAVVVAVSDALTAPVIQALSDADANVTVLGPSTSVGSKSTAVAHQDNIPLRVSAGWAVEPGKFPARQEMLDNIKKFGTLVGAPSNMDTTSDNAYNMYMGIITLAKVMNGAKSLSTADMQAYIAANPVATGVAPPLDWGKAGPVPGSPRIVQIYGTAETVDGNGDLVSTSKIWGSSFGAPEVTCCS